MILSKIDRDKLRKIIFDECKNESNTSLDKDLFRIISALISDFEELESIIAKMYTIFISGKEITDVLDSISEILSPDITNSLHFEEHAKLIKNLSILITNTEKLKYALIKLRRSKQYIIH